MLSPINGAVSLQTVQYVCVSLRKRDVYFGQIHLGQTQAIVGIGLK